MLKWKRRVVGFYGNGQKEKNILIGKAVGELCSKSSGFQATIKTYREFVSVAT